MVMTWRVGQHWVLLSLLVYATSVAAQIKAEPPVILVTAHELSVSGAESLSTAELQELRRKIVDQEDTQEELVEKLRHELAVAVGNHGYLQGNIHIDVQPVGLSDPVRIDLRATVRQGIQYRLRHFEFEGNHAFTSAQLLQMVPVAETREGDLRGLRYVYGDVNKFYKKAGYRSAKAVPHLKYDEGQGVFDVVVKIDEGAAPPDVELRDPK